MFNSIFSYMLLLSFSVVGSGGTRIAVVTKDNERHGASWDEYVPTGRGGQKGVQAGACLLQCSTDFNRWTLNHS